LVFEPEVVTPYILGRREYYLPSTLVPPTVQKLGLSHPLYQTKDLDVHIFLKVGWPYPTQPWPQIKHGEFWCPVYELKELGIDRIPKHINNGTCTLQYIAKCGEPDILHLYSI
jgi:hypothetical protein